MVTPSPALDRFRAAYSDLLIAAEQVRVELDPVGAGNAPSDISTIQIIVADYFQIPRQRLLSRARDNETAGARHLAMAFCREVTPHSLTIIGQAFNRDHGTVMHAINAVRIRCEQDAAFKLVSQKLRTLAQTTIKAKA
jgi:chromosomal replication initiation ATPase DnaA